MEPKLSHKQIAVLEALGPRELSGKELRESLKKLGMVTGGPAFYQFMARLEDAKFVEGRYEEIEVEGHKVRERRYTLLGAGAKALQDARAYYRQVFGIPGLGVAEKLIRRMLRVFIPTV